MAKVQLLESHCSFYPSSSHRSSLDPIRLVLSSHIVTANVANRSTPFLSHIAIWTLVVALYIRPTPHVGLRSRQPLISCQRRRQPLFLAPSTLRDRLTCTVQQQLRLHHFLFETSAVSAPATLVRLSSLINPVVSNSPFLLHPQPSTGKPVLLRLIRSENVRADDSMFLGGPTSAVIALQNPNVRVTVVDRDAARIARWNSKHLPVHEPGLYDVVRSARDGLRATSIYIGAPSTSPSDMSARAPNLFFSTDIAKAIAAADLILLSVNTPTKMTGIGAGQATNMSALEGATRDIAVSAKPGAIVVEKSTVPCRTAQIIRDTVSQPSPLQSPDRRLANDVSSQSTGLAYLSRSSPIRNSSPRERPSKTS